MIGIIEVLSFVVSSPELGWIIVFAYFIWEMRSPRGKIASIKKDITASITVIRAMARTNENIDTDEVDAYLVENGAEPDDFVVQEELEKPDQLIQQD